MYTKRLGGNIRNAALSILRHYKWKCHSEPSVSLKNFSAKGSTIIHEFKAIQSHTKLRCFSVVSEPKVAFVMENFNHIPKWRDCASIYLSA